MDKVRLTGQNLDRTLNVVVCAIHWLCNKQELKTQSKQRLSYLPFYISHPVKTDRSKRYQGTLRKGEGSVRMTSFKEVIRTVLTSLDQLIFKLKILLTLVTKQATLTRRSTVLSLPLQLVFPADTLDCNLPLQLPSSSRMLAGSLSARSSTTRTQSRRMTDWGI
jgi:hypothetical protein